MRSPANNARKLYAVRDLAAKSLDSEVTGRAERPRREFPTSFRSEQILAALSRSRDEEAARSGLKCDGPLLDDRRSRRDRWPAIRASCFAGSMRTRASSRT